MALLQLSPLLAMLTSPKGGKTKISTTKEEGALFFKELFELLQAESPETDAEADTPLLKMVRRYKDTVEPEELPIELVPKQGETVVKDLPYASKTALHESNTRETPLSEKRSKPLLQSVLIDGKIHLRMPVTERSEEKVTKETKQKDTEILEKGVQSGKIGRNIFIEIEPLPVQTAPKETSKNTSNLSFVKTSVPYSRPSLSPPSLSGERELQESTTSSREKSDPPTFRHHSLRPAPQTETTMHETVGPVRQTRHIGDLLHMAEKAELNPVKVVVEQKRAPQKPSKRTLHGKEESLPERPQNISKSVASLIRKFTPVKPHTVAVPLSEKENEEFPPPKQKEATPTLRDNVTLKPENPLKELMQRLHPTGPHAGHEAKTSRPAEGSSERNGPTSQPIDRGDTSIPDTAFDISVAEPDPLHGESLKANETLHQKIADAKATVRHFAQTLQEQIESYKPPFTRMKLMLEPKELGTVELTLVNRGNNLHIQVHSNPNAIGIMATQGSELRNQLVSMGFTDVQMQFNMQQQQQQQRHARNAPAGGDHAGAEDIPEFYDSLNIIIPQYI